MYNILNLITIHRCFLFLSHKFYLNFERQSFIQQLVQTSNIYKLVFRVLWVDFSDVIEADGDVPNCHVGLQEVSKSGRCGRWPVEGEAHGALVRIFAPTQPAERRCFFTCQLTLHVCFLHLGKMENLVNQTSL